MLGGYAPFRATSKEEMIRVTLKGNISFHEVFWSKISDQGQCLWCFRLLPVLS